MTASDPAEEFLELLSGEERRSFAERVLRAIPTAVLPSAWLPLAGGRPAANDTHMQAAPNQLQDSVAFGSSLPVKSQDSPRSGGDGQGGTDQQGHFRIVRSLLYVALDNQPVQLAEYSPALRRWRRADGDTPATVRRAAHESRENVNRRLIANYDRVLSVVDAQLQLTTELDLMWFGRLHQFWGDALAWSSSRQISALASNASERVRLRSRVERLKNRLETWKQTAKTADSFTSARSGFQRDLDSLLSVMKNRLEADLAPFPLRYLSLLYALKVCDIAEHDPDSTEVEQALLRALLTLAYAWLVLSRFVQSHAHKREERQV
jgi:hypothetical protein